jgi:hypothetical protein
MGFLTKRLTYACLVTVTAVSGLMSGCGSNSSTPLVAAQPATTATLLYTSDAHYGIKRDAAHVVTIAFNNYSNAQQLNSAMVTVMNGMPAVALPSDTGVNAGTTIGKVDYVIQGGDISNRMQADPTSGYAQVQSAWDSWKQFETGFINTLKFPTLLIPGNHDVSNAIGYSNGGGATKILNNGSGPNTFDGSVMAFIYNKFVKAGTFDTSTKSAAQASYTNATYQDAANKIYYSKDIAGVHFMFISMWPDLDAQAWMETELSKISSTSPAVIVTHDQPDTEAKHLTDLAGPASWANGFENLLVNISPTATTGTSDTIAAQRTFVRFLQRHKNIVAYFHGNTNYNDLGTCDSNGVKLTGIASNTTGCYQGPDPVANPVYLPWFRVDSPMKGEITGVAAKVAPAACTAGVNCLEIDKLSYHVISIDSAAKKMTVREYRWKTQTWGADPGSFATIPLTPRTK